MNIDEVWDDAGAEFDRALADIEAKFLGFEDWIEYVEARRMADEEDARGYDRDTTTRYDGH